MKFQPYRSHWSRYSFNVAGWRGESRRWWKQHTHRLYRRLTREAIRAGEETPYKISVDDGS